MKRPLLLGLAAWVVAFAVLFGALYALVLWSDKPGPDNDTLTTWLAWALFVLPHATSSILGSAIYARRRPTSDRGSRAAVIFAVSTCAATTFGTVLWYSFIDRDRPDGFQLVVWFLAVWAIFFVMGGILAGSGAHLVARQAQRRRSRTSKGD